MLTKKHLPVLRRGSGLYGMLSPAEYVTFVFHSMYLYFEHVTLFVFHFTYWYFHISHVKIVGDGALS